MRRRKEHPIRFFALTRQVHDAADVSAVLRVLLAHGQPLTPTVYGYSEPLRSKFDRERLDEVGKWIGEGSLLFLRMPAAELTLSNHSAGYAYGLFSLSLTRDGLHPAELTTLVREISAILQPEIGFVHLLNDHDLEADCRKGLRLNGTIPEPHFGLHFRTLKFGLPEFYWGMVFGRPYTELLGESKLMQLPAFRVESVATGVVYAQLTADFADCWDDHGQLQRARDAAKHYAGKAAFMHDDISFDGAGDRVLPLFSRLFSPRRVVPDLRP